MWKELNSREPDDFCFFPALKCGEEKQAVGEKKYWITKLVYGVSLFIINFRTVFSIPINNTILI